MRGSVDRIWTEDYLLCYHDKLLFVLQVKIVKKWWMWLFNLIIF